MQALVWHGNRDVRVETVPKPVVTDPRDALVKVTGTTVCGSDLHLYHKEIMQLRVGDILGHEWMGVVEDVGPEVKHIKKGDRVVASFQIACGDCSFCKQDLSSMCVCGVAFPLVCLAAADCSLGPHELLRNPGEALRYVHPVLPLLVPGANSYTAGKPFAGLFGYSHFAGGYAGGQAEYVRCPYADTNLLQVPDGVPDEKALFLSDIVPTSYHATECAEVKEGKSVAVWGLGPVGLFATKWSTIKKARRVIAIDRVAERLALAKSWGCDTINIDETKDVVAEIYKLEPEGVDCSIDAAAFLTRSLSSTLSSVPSVS